MPAAAKKKQPGGWVNSQGRRYRTKADAKRDTPEWVHGQVEAAERFLRNEASRLRKSIAARQQTTIPRNFDHAPDEALIAELEWAARVIETAANSIQQALYKRGLA